MSALSFSLSSKAAVSVKAVALRKNAGKAVKPRGMTVMAYKVTLETPEGTQEIECADDTYILDAAEVRWIERARGLFYPVVVGGGGAGCVQRRAWTTTTTTGIGHREATRETPAIRVLREPARRGGVPTRRVDENRRLTNETFIFSADS